MAVPAKEIRRWLSEIDDQVMIGVDEGGLTLVAYKADATQSERINADYDPSTAADYFEIGGVDIECEVCEKEECVCEDKGDRS